MGLFIGVGEGCLCFIVFYDDGGVGSVVDCSVCGESDKRGCVWCWIRYY